MRQSKWLLVAVISLMPMFVVATASAHGQGNSSTQLVKNGKGKHHHKGHHHGHHHKRNKKATT